MTYMNIMFKKTEIRDFEQPGKLSIKDIKINIFNSFSAANNTSIFFCTFTIFLHLRVVLFDPSIPICLEAITKKSCFIICISWCNEIS